MATPARPVTSTSFQAPAAAPAVPQGGTPPATGTMHFLQRIKLFSGLSVEDCAEVVKRMKRRDFPPNHIIVREGQPGTSMFFITSGGVEVRKKDANTGIDFLLTELGPGQNFGEMSLLTGKPRTASVSTNQPSTCAVLEQADFQDLLMQYPKIGLALTTILAERVESANQQVGIEYINLSKMNFDARVLNLLPQTMMVQHRVIPVSFANNRLTLAMTNPNNLIALDDIRRVIKGVMIEPVVTTEDDFKKFMSTTFAELTKKDEPAGKPTEIKSPSMSMSELESDIIRDLQMAED
ncbi:MAG: cyclic nucleotide-binding domain-containing protein, partial [Terriglobales bacterium]